MDSGVYRTERGDIRMSRGNCFPAINLQNPECPRCGSKHAIRISGAALPDETFDDKASGIFRCGHCREEYQFLALLPAQTKPQVFSPTACCPGCSSWKTKTVSVHTVKRYHICLDCKRSFTTVRPANERLSRR